MDPAHIRRAAQRGTLSTSWGASPFGVIPPPKFRRAFSWRMVLLVPLLVSGGLHSNVSDIWASHQKENTQQIPVANLHSYVDEPIEQLMKSIPELKTLQPATDQQRLPFILKNTGERVNEYFDNLVDLVADEKITQRRLAAFGVSSGKESVRDNYLILRHGKRDRIELDEFRMDEKGNRLDDVSQTNGFIVTSGFALTCAILSSGNQQESSFRYLGDQIIGGQETYVLTFAQRPETKLRFTVREPTGATVQILRQGAAWVDKENFHILRMRTDLLDPNPEIDKQTTEVTFSEVRFADIPVPLWLPRDVAVYLKLGQSLDRPYVARFQNKHHYQNYRRYRVSTKMLAPY